MRFKAFQRAYQQRYLRSGYSCRHRLSHSSDSNCDFLGTGRSRRGGPSSRSSRTRDGAGGETGNSELRAFREEVRWEPESSTFPSRATTPEEDSIRNRDFRDGGERQRPSRLRPRLRPRGETARPQIGNLLGCEV